MTCGESTLAYTWTGNDAQYVLSLAIVSDRALFSAPSPSPLESKNPTGTERHSLHADTKSHRFNTNISSLVRGVTTVSCAVYGGISATSADCTGVSAVPSDNFAANSTTTTTLDASQISYMPIIITAGAASASSGLVLATSSNGNPDSTHASATSASVSRGASVPMATSVMKYAIGGAVAGWCVVAMF